ncbi:MAG: hypothetical protein COB60_11060 [Flavobacteriaceae bacterium]|nr:MAG: hypothetical protein COB60_11060 [Flavobacteriaceae bacterium]
MKYLSKITFVLFLSLVFSSCSKDETSTEALALSFDESVAIIQYSNNILSKTKSSEEAIIIEIKNFNSDLVLKTEYYIDGIQYTDDGQFNDEIAGDGLFTSIQTYLSKNLKSSNTQDELNLGQNFKFNNELKSFLKKKYGYNTATNNFAKSTALAKIKFGCKVRTVVCPETSWWNSCWPLSSPCTCVEFYDCEASIEL